MSVAGSGVGALLHGAQDDGGAGRARQAREFLEHDVGIEPAGGARDQAHERRAFERRLVRHSPANAHAFSDSSTRSQAIAPSRTSVRRGPRASTIVEGAPPGVGPASITSDLRIERDLAERRRHRSPAARPLRFALVAVTGAPHASASARATG